MSGEAAGSSGGEEAEVQCVCCTLLIQRHVHIKCAECDAILCQPCFRMGAEIGSHRRGHNYEVVDPVGEPTQHTRDSWGCIEEAKLINAAHRYKLGNWGEIVRMMKSDRTASQAQEYFDRYFIRGPLGQIALKQIGWEKTKRTMLKNGTINVLLQDDVNETLRFILIREALRDCADQLDPNDAQLSHRVNEILAEYLQKIKRMSAGADSTISGASLTKQLSVLSDDSDDPSDVEEQDKMKTQQTLVLAGLDAEVDTDEEEPSQGGSRDASVPVLVVKDKGKMNLRAELRDKKSPSKSPKKECEGGLRPKKSDTARKQRKTVQNNQKASKYRRIHKMSSSEDDEQAESDNDKEESEFEEEEASDSPPPKRIKAELDDEETGDDFDESDDGSRSPQKTPKTPKSCRRKRRAFGSKRERRLKYLKKKYRRTTNNREKKLQMLYELIPPEELRALRASHTTLALDRSRPSTDKPRIKPDDLNMLAYNVDRDDFEMEFHNEAEHLISRLTITPAQEKDKTLDMENEIKFAKVHRYLRILRARRAKRRAIVEHDKVSEFFAFMKKMTLERRKASTIMAEKTPREKILTRAQQSLSKEELGDLTATLGKADTLMERIQRLQQLQRDGVTTLKAVAHSLLARCIVDAWLRALRRTATCREMRVEGHDEEPETLEWQEEENEMPMFRVAGVSGDVLVDMQVLRIRSRDVYKGVHLGETAGYRQASQQNPNYDYMHQSGQAGSGGGGGQQQQQYQTGYTGYQQYPMMQQQASHQPAMPQMQGGMMAAGGMPDLGADLDLGFDDIEVMDTGVQPEQLMQQQYMQRQQQQQMGYPLGQQQRMHVQQHHMMSQQQQMATMQQQHRTTPIPDSPQRMQQPQQQQQQRLPVQMQRHAQQQQQTAQQASLLRHVLQEPPMRTTVAYPSTAAVQYPQGSIQQPAQMTRAMLLQQQQQRPASRSSPQQQQQQQPTSAISSRDGNFRLVNLQGIPMQGIRAGSIAQARLVHCQTPPSQATAHHHMMPTQAQVSRPMSAQPMQQTTTVAAQQTQQQPARIQTSQMQNMGYQHYDETSMYPQTATATQQHQPSCEQAQQQQYMQYQYPQQTMAQQQQQAGQYLSPPETQQQYTSPTPQVYASPTEQQQAKQVYTSPQVYASPTEQQQTKQVYTSPQVYASPTEQQQAKQVYTSPQVYASPTEQQQAAKQVYTSPQSVATLYATPPEQQQQQHYTSPSTSQQVFTPPTPVQQQQQQQQQAFDALLDEALLEEPLPDESSAPDEDLLKELERFDALLGEVSSQHEAKNEQRRKEKEMGQRADSVSSKDSDSVFAFFVHPDTDLFELEQMERQQQQPIVNNDPWMVVRAEQERNDASTPAMVGGCAYDKDAWQEMEQRQAMDEPPVETFQPEQLDEEMRLMGIVDESSRDVDELRMAEQEEREKKRILDELTADVPVTLTTPATPPLDKPGPSAVMVVEEEEVVVVEEKRKRGRPRKDEKKKKKSVTSRIIGLFTDKRKSDEEKEKAVAVEKKAEKEVKEKERVTREKERVTREKEPVVVRREEKAEKPPKEKRESKELKEIPLFFDLPKPTPKKSPREKEREREREREKERERAARELQRSASTSSQKRHKEKKEERREKEHREREKEMRKKKVVISSDEEAPAASSSTAVEKRPRHPREHKKARRERSSSTESMLPVLYADKPKRDKEKEKLMHAEQKRREERKKEEKRREKHKPLVQPTDLPFVTTMKALSNYRIPKQKKEPREKEQQQEQQRAVELPREVVVQRVTTEARREKRREERPTPLHRPEPEPARLDSFDPYDEVPKTPGAGGLSASPELVLPRTPGRDCHGDSDMDICDDSDMEPTAPSPCYDGNPRTPLRSPTPERTPTPEEVNMMVELFSPSKFMSAAAVLPKSRRGFMEKRVRETREEEVSVECKFHCPSEKARTEKNMYKHRLLERDSLSLTGLESRMRRAGQRASVGGEMPVPRLETMKASVHQPAESETAMETAFHKEASESTEFHVRKQFGTNYSRVSARMREMGEAECWLDVELRGVEEGASAETTLEHKRMERCETTTDEATLDDCSEEVRHEVARLRTAGDEEWAQWLPTFYALFDSTRLLERADEVCSKLDTLFPLASTYGEKRSLLCNLFARVDPSLFLARPWGEEAFAAAERVLNRLDAKRTPVEEEGALPMEELLAMPTKSVCWRAEWRAEYCRLDDAPLVKQARKLWWLMQMLDGRVVAVVPAISEKQCCMLSLLVRLHRERPWPSDAQPPVGYCRLVANMMRHPRVTRLAHNQLPPELRVIAATGRVGVLPLPAKALHHAVYLWTRQYRGESLTEWRRCREPTPMRKEFEMIESRVLPQLTALERAHPATHSTTITLEQMNTAERLMRDDPETALYAEAMDRFARLTADRVGRETHVKLASMRASVVERCAPRQLAACDVPWAELDPLCWTDALWTEVETHWSGVEWDETNALHTLKVSSVASRHQPRSADSPRRNRSRSARRACAGSASNAGRFDSSRSASDRIDEVWIGQLKLNDFVVVSVPWYDCSPAVLQRNREKCLHEVELWSGRDPIEYVSSLIANLHLSRNSDDTQRDASLISNLVETMRDVNLSRANVETRLLEQLQAQLLHQQLRQMSLRVPVHVIHQEPLDLPQPAPAEPEPVAPVAPVAEPEPAPEPVQQADGDEPMEQVVEDEEEEEQEEQLVDLVEEEEQSDEMEEGVDSNAPSPEI